MEFQIFLYPRQLLKARFLKRYKRFFADVYLETDAEKNIFPVHCANSGSMKSCVENEAEALILDSENPERKLQYSLEGLKLEDGWACLNTQRANQILHSLMMARTNLNPQDFPGADLFLKDFKCGHFKAEAKFNAATRFDGLLVNDEKKHWIEMKSVSLRLSPAKIGFPDAVTERGTKHLNELRNSLSSNSDATLIFAVMRGNNLDAQELASQFEIAYQIDSVYARAAHEARKAGVRFRLLITGMNENGLSVRGYSDLSSF